jgi:hypothetical protein
VSFALDALRLIGLASADASERAVCSGRIRAKPKAGATGASLPWTFVEARGPIRRLTLP